MAANAEDLLDEVLRSLAHLAAGVLRGGAVEEGGVSSRPGRWRRRAAQVFLSMRTTCDAVGRVKGLTSEYCGSLMARFMNSAQMGAAASAPWSLDVGVVVVADPDDAEQVGGVAGEPGVVGGAGLAGGGRGEAVGADAGGGAEGHDAFAAGTG